ncbi:MAG TPA: serine/threonine-protein kinase [Vicinamibacterales bacterium]|nr:serine/threonine-protein kinase [Vicinamibacterales bacterium]
MVFRGQTLGKYRILEPLGSGGFGTVYLAEDTWIDKRVALKVPHRQNLDFGELLREPRLLASLNHPNIVTVITAEKQDGVFFIVMEYVPGETLETIIAARGALDVATVLDYTCQIANAVEHAHKQGVIHRDLRPANVFVTEKGVVKVGDFGTSRFLEIAAHGTTVIGSPPYMAPEQFEGRAVFASDLYSLGITMYQMLTGELPYDTPAPSDLDRLRRGELVRPPRSRYPHLPIAVDDIVMRALAASLAERYQRAEDMLHDILNVRRELAKKGTTGWTGAIGAPNMPGFPGNGGSARASIPAIAPDDAPGPEYYAPAPPSGSSGHEPPAPNRVPSRMARRVTPSRIRTREITATRFCWNCRKALPAKAAQCPFCNETQ